MSRPTTRYARSGDTNIAYQILGEGPLDVIYVPPFVSNLELYWEPQSLEGDFFRRIAQFCRLIIFDKRGTGLSDRVMPGTLEERMDDIRAVQKAVGSTRSVLLGVSDGGPMSMLYAATYPDRVRSLILYGTFAMNNRGEEGHAQLRAFYERAWGTGEGWADLYSHLSESDAIAAAGRAERLSASPGAVLAMHEMNTKIDIRHVLSTITVPTLVLHQTEDTRVPVMASHYIARKIPGAVMKELPGHRHFPQIGDWEPMVSEIQEFLTGSRPEPPADRVLATVLFTDIVDSTRVAQERGDDRWRRTLDRHDEIARMNVQRFRGRWVKSTGDGILAMFDGPARAVSCAVALGEAARSLGLEIRAGLHAGECELRGDDVTGISVHTAQRVAERAGAGEVLVSRTVTDLVAGSGLEFDDRGEHELKGVPGRWQLYAVKT